MRVVDGLHPSGAVGPRHVSRKRIFRGATIWLTLLAEPCDSKTINLASALSDADEFSPSSAVPSGAAEILTVEGTHAAGASVPRQVSCKKIWEPWLSTLDPTAAFVRKAMYRPVLEIFSCDGWPSSATSKPSTTNGIVSGTHATLAVGPAQLSRTYTRPRFTDLSGTMLVTIEAKAAYRPSTLNDAGESKCRGPFTPRSNNSV